MGNRVAPDISWVVDEDTGIVSGQRLASGEVVPLGGVTTVDGEDYLRLPDGSLMPLIFLSGDREESDVVGVRRSTLLIDSGGASHAQLLWTLNCTLAGNPLTPDDALASQRFVDYATSPDVFATGIDGAGTSQLYLIRASSGVSMIHFALAGEASYTADADHQFGATTMGHIEFPDHDTSPAVAVIVTLLSSYTAGRYREVSVHPYSGAA